jgi:DNA-binding MarR family transcriptional regulator
MREDTISHCPTTLVLLARLSKQVMHRSPADLLGIDMRKFIALSYLRDHDGAPQQELADALCVDASNVVLVLNELEDLGYIERRRDREDRRRHRVTITAAGRAAYGRAEKAQREIEDEVLQALDEQEREVLRGLLLRALRDAEPGAGAAGTLTALALSAS